MTVRPGALLLIVCFFAYACPVPGRGQMAMRHGVDFIPIDHWSYTYITLLQERGIFRQMFTSVRPYSRMEIVAALESTNESELQDPERTWFRMLSKEFLMRGHPDSAATYLYTEWKATSDGYRRQEDTRFDYAVWPEIRLVTDYVAISGRGRIDRALTHDSTYSGRKAGQVAARLEDGYGVVCWRGLSMLVGRLNRHWSPVESSSLVLSSNAYSYDQIAFGYRSRHVALNSVFTRLNDLGTAQRYFSAHRLDIRLNNGINFGFTETVVFGGINQGMELAYANPFTIFANAQLNDKKEANEVLAFDVFVPFRRYLFKGQFLVDDFILDGADQPAPNRKTSPDRLGLQLELTANDVLFKACQWTVGYTRIGSYTYNVKQKRPWQSYTANERGLGYAVNDFDRLSLTWRGMGFDNFILSATIGYDRQGARSLSSNDFEDSTFVRLSFPSGTVERRSWMVTTCRYQKSPSLVLTASLGLERMTNRRHVPDARKTSPIFHLSLAYVGRFFVPV